MSIAVSRVSKAFIFVCATAMLFFWAHTASAQERSINLHFSATDQFGNSFDRAPQVHLATCNIHKTGLVKADTTIPNRYNVELFYDHTETSTHCTATFSSPGFVSSGSVDLGNIQADKNFDISSETITLAYTLVVRPYDEDGTSITNADIFYEGASARHASGGAYYFAAQNIGALEIGHPTYLPQSQTTDGLLGVISVNDKSTKSVSFKGSGSCVKSGSAISCGALQSRASISVVNTAGTLISDTKVTLYTDRARTKIAQEIGAVARDATHIINATKVNFAVMPGTYFAEVVRQRYNTIHETIEVSEDKKTDISFTADLESISKVSPTRSAVTTTRTSATANLVDTVVVNIIARSSDNTLLRSREVEIDTGNSTDVIEFAAGSTTNNQGLVIIYLTASQAGERTLVAKIGDLIISDFPKVTFEADLDEAKADAKKSYTEQTPSPILVGGVEEVTITLFAKNYKGEFLSGLDAGLSSNRGSIDNIECDNGKTTSGKVKCIFSSNEAGTSILTATVDGVKIDQIAVSVSPIPS